jgi:hypothetical protein
MYVDMYVIDISKNISIKIIDIYQKTTSLNLKLNSLIMQLNDISNILIV